VATTNLRIEDKSLKTLLCKASNKVKGKSILKAPNTDKQKLYTKESIRVADKFSNRYLIVPEERFTMNLEYLGN